MLLSQSQEMPMPSEPKDLSRRILFQRVANYVVGAAIVAGLGPNLGAAQGKVAQTAVAYQDKPKGTQRCDGCSLFQAPNACKVVDGAISPQGWCSLFSAKT
jgi:hypothetical protein